MSTLGERLKIARQKCGLKQIQVKERTNINNKTLSGYENDVSEPDTNTLAILAELYGVSHKWLLTGTGEMSIKSNNKNSTSLTEKDERDIGKRMAKIREDLIEGISDDDKTALSFMGEPMSEEAIESLLEALEHAERLATLANKKYIPKKYRKE